MINFLICLFPVFGNIHGHTSYSDGSGTPRDAYEFAKSHNLNFYGLTDHSHHLDENEWQNIIFWADSFNNTGFVAIYGQEIGKLNHFGHINVYGENLNEVIPEKCWYNLDSLYDYIYRKDLTGIFNHPWENHFNDFEFNNKYEDFICGIEIINKDSVYEKNCIKALSKGWKLGFIASQDNHEMNWGIERNKRGRIPQTAFIVDSLSRDNIFKALRERKTYAFELFPDEDTIFAELKVDDSISGKYMLKNSPLIRINLNVKAKIPFIKVFIFIDSLPDSIFFYSNQIQIQREYYISEGKHFVFAKLIQADFDRVWISPVFLLIKNNLIIYPSITSKQDMRLNLQNENVAVFSINGSKIRFLEKVHRGILFIKKDKKRQKVVLIK